MAKINIVYTDQKTFEEPIVPVPDHLDEKQITEVVGHDDWDYALSDGTPTVQSDAQVKKTSRSR